VPRVIARWSWTVIAISGEKGTDLFMMMRSPINKSVPFSFADIMKKEITFHVGAATVTSTLGKVFTSEKSVAILLRWHVYRPSHVVNDDYEKITPIVQQAVNGTAGVNWQSAVASWGDAHEVALTEKLLSAAAAINSTITTSIAFGATQPQGSVRTGRNTFVLEV